MASVAAAQSGGGRGFSGSPGGQPAGPLPAAPTRAARPTGGLSEFATDEPVVEIRVKGNRTVPPSRVTAQMQTRVGRPFDPKALGRDVRKLAQLPYFVTVRPFTERVEGGRVVILEVVERATTRYVVFLGNEAINDKRLLEETGLRVGGAIDPYSVEEGRRKLEELYQAEGYGRAHVKVEEGLERDDHGVTYLINEGPKQRVWEVKFEGNRFASDGQLKTKIQTKPGFTKIWGSTIKADLLAGDLVSLTDYYRSFGFFGARVGRVLEFDDDGEWATLTFVVDEGPRYSVRNISFFGAKKFDSNDFAERIQLSEGQPFERAKLNADIGWLKEVYGSKGYVFADIQAETVFLEEPGKIDLVYNVDEGSRFRVGEIHVRINGEASHTRVQTALNRLSVRPGQWIDTREILASERRLRASSLFNTNPAQGSPPKISYQISNPGGTRLAENPQPQTAYKPIVEEWRRPSQVYRVQQVGGAVDQALAPPPGNTAPAAGLNYNGGAYGLPAGGRPIAPAPASTGAPLNAGPPTVSLPPQGVALPPPPVTQAFATQPTAGATNSVAPTQFLGPPVAGVGPGLLPGPTTIRSPGLPPNDPTVDLYVNLEETQTGRFMVGAAVNSDAGVVGQILLDEQNFDWRRFPTSFQDFRDGTAFRGGGQRFRLEASPGSQVQRYIVNWQEPYLLDTPISLSLSGSFFTRRFADYDEQRLGGRVGLGYQWTDNDLSAQLTYRGENVEVSGVSVGDADLPELAEVIGDNTLHGFGVRVVNDTRDNPFLATEGYFLSTTLEGVVGSFDYPRAEFEGRSYYLLRERPDHTGRHVLVLQTRLGFTGSNTPLYDRFFAGGFATLRGFDFREASPVSVDDNGFAVVGGDFRWINTIEYLFPLTADGMINGVAFVDFGTVEESVEIEDFRVAPGVGLRLTVPALGPAPIALDFAFPVASADFDDEQVFTFNVGFLR